MNAATSTPCVGGQYAISQEAEGWRVWERQPDGRYILALCCRTFSTRNRAAEALQEFVETEARWARATEWLNEGRW